MRDTAAAHIKQLTPMELSRSVQASSTKIPQQKRKKDSVEYKPEHDKRNKSLWPNWHGSRIHQTKTPMGLSRRVQASSTEVSRHKSKDSVEYETGHDKSYTIPCAASYQTSRIESSLGTLLVAKDTELLHAGTKDSDQTVSDEQADMSPLWVLKKVFSCSGSAI